MMSRIALSIFWSRSSCIFGLTIFHAFFLFFLDHDLTDFLEDPNAVGLAFEPRSLIWGDSSFVSYLEADAFKPLLSVWPIASRLSGWSTVANWVFDRLWFTLTVLNISMSSSNFLGTYNSFDCLNFGETAWVSDFMSGDRNLFWSSLFYLSLILSVSLSGISIGSDFFLAMEPKMPALDPWILPSLWATDMSI